MLQVAPAHWYSWDFTVKDESRLVAVVDMSRWREKVALTIAGTTYRVYREGLMSGAFVLQHAGSVLAQRSQTSSVARALPDASNIMRPRVAE